MIIDAANLQILRDSINTRFQGGIKAAAAWWNMLAMLVPSSTAMNTYAWTEDVPRFREWVGERVAHDLKSRAAQIVNKIWEDTLRIPRTALEDDQYGLYGNYAEMMGIQARKLPDDLVYALMKAGASSLCYDGQYFFDTDHPVDVEDAGSGIQANRFTAKPLTGDNFAAVRAAMRGYKLGRAKRVIGVNPTMLCVGPDLEKTAREIVTAERLANGADNVQRGLATVHVIPEADEAGVWYLCDATSPIKPFVWQERTPVEWTAKFDPSSDHVFKFDEFLFGGRMRGNAGYGLWFLCARCEPT